MKKIFTVFIALWLAVSWVFCAAAEAPSGLPAVTEQAAETAAAGDFREALAAWAAGPAGRQDLKATLLTADSEPREMTIRRDAGITELAVADLGRLQISENAIALEIGDFRYTFDLNRFRGDERPFLPEADTLRPDLEMIRPWLDRALKEILLPHARFGLSFRGITVHVEATDESLREKAAAWFDQLVQERTVLETLIAHYGRFLRTFFPFIPRSFDELKETWEAEKANPSIPWPDFTVTADITYGKGFSGTSISCDANLYCKGLGWGKLSLELARSRGSLDLITSLDTNDESGRRNSFGLDFHSRGDKLDAILLIPRNTFTLSAERLPDADSRTVRYTATLDEQLGRTQLQLNAVYNLADASVKGDLCRLRTDSDEAPVRVAAWDLFMRANGWDASLLLPAYAGVRLALHRTRDEQYNRLKLDVGSSYGSLYTDLWIYHALEDERRIRLETDMFNQYDPCTYNLILTRNGFEAYRASVRGEQTDWSLKASRTVTENGWEINAEYLNRVSRSYTFNTGDRPSTLQVVRDGATVTGTLDWSSVGSRSLLARLDPDRLTWTQDGITRTLGVQENAPEKMVVLLTEAQEGRNADRVLADLTLTLEEDVLRGVLTVGDEEKARLTVEPVPKEPIRRITGP